MSSMKEGKTGVIFVLYTIVRCCDLGYEIPGNRTRKSSGCCKGGICIAISSALAMSLHFKEKATENRCFPEFEAVGRTTCLYFQISNSGVTSKVSVTAISKFYSRNDFLDIYDKPVTDKSILNTLEIAHLW